MVERRDGQAIHTALKVAHSGTRVFCEEEGWKLEAGHGLQGTEQHHDKELFTKFDVRNGYNNIRIKKGDEWKGAFICNRGLFEPLVMYFGMSNSPATFQAYMNDIFEKLIL